MLARCDCSSYSSPTACYSHCNNMYNRNKLLDPSSKNKLFYSHTFTLLVKRYNRADENIYPQENHIVKCDPMHALLPKVPWDNSFSL